MHCKVVEMIVYLSINCLLIQKLRLTLPFTLSNSLHKDNLHYSQIQRESGVVFVEKILLFLNKWRTANLVLPRNLKIVSLLYHLVIIDVCNIKLKYKHCQIYESIFQGLLLQFEVNVTVMIALNSGLDVD